MRDRSCSSGWNAVKLKVLKMLGFRRLNALLLESRLAVYPALTVYPVERSC
jgi:hypothetical protein